jgi:aspartyl-tRNA(Asn)/glutamyl-tRNA(Gln) amidotransferase subunit A
MGITTVDHPLAARPLADIARGLRTGTFRARDVVEDLLARCETAAPCNAFATIDPAMARRDADAVDAAIAAGRDPGPLAGIPISVKDLLNTRGMRTAWGSRAFADNVPDSDASAVRALREAGAILYAKTTTPEFGHKIVTDSPLHGITRNPWNLERTSGGSSGGGAVATALGLGPVAITTDGAGSSRLPAACCGVYGIKPTLGRIPHETAPDTFGLTVNIGAMARHPGDLALPLSIMAATDPTDAWSLAAGDRPFGVVQPDTALRGRRVKMIRTLNGSWLDPEVEAALETAADHMRALGAEVVAYDGLRMNWGLAEARLLLRINQTERYAKLIAERGDILDRSFMENVREGLGADAGDLRRALFARTTLFRDTLALMADCDYLLMPIFNTPAIPATQYVHDPLVVDGRDLGDLRSGWYSYTVPQNLTGHPAIALPISQSSAGLPIGVQAIGRWFSEADLIGLACAMDTRTGASGILPPLHA